MPLEKLKSLTELKEIVARLKRQGKKIVFTNGCFDLIHVGHVRCLRKAKSYGDILIVAINSDKSARRIKGKNRPVIPEKERAEILSSFSSVDYVTIFPENSSAPTISALLPDVLVKGGDWPVNGVVGREIVEGSGGKVYRIPPAKCLSTTDLIKKITSQARRRGHNT